MVESKHPSDSTSFEVIGYVRLTVAKNGWILVVKRGWHVRWNHKLKSKAEGARSYRSSAALLGAPQQEGLINVFFTADVACFPTLPFDVGAPKKVDFDAVVAFWLCEGELNSSTDRLARTIDL